MNATCATARLRIRRLGTGEIPEGRLGLHARSCLRCQLESARSRSVPRRLAGLADEVLAAPAGIPEAVNARIGGAPVLVIDERERGRIRGAIAVAAAGAAMAATAGTLAAVGWWRLRAVA